MEFKENCPILRFDGFAKKSYIDGNIGPTHMITKSKRIKVKSHEGERWFISLNGFTNRKLLKCICKIEKYDPCENFVYLERVERRGNNYFVVVWGK